MNFTRIPYKAYKCWFWVHDLSAPPIKNIFLTTWQTTNSLALLELQLGWLIEFFSMLTIFIYNSSTDDPHGWVEHMQLNKCGGK